MEPAIKEGSEILASSFPYIFIKPKRGDVVVFRKDNFIFVKRIERILRDKYFLKGDNENDSLDSRSFGFIDRKDILGKVI